MRTPRMPGPVRPAPWAGWAALAAGAVLCVLGWYGVSGERFAERQLPYLASCTVPGAALIVAGAVLLGRGEDGVAADRVAEVHRLLVAAGEPDDASPASSGPADAPAPHDGAAGSAARREPAAQEAGPPLAVPGGTLVHRPSCPLVAAKPDAFPAGPEVRRELGLTACPLCEPALDDPGQGA